MEESFLEIRFQNGRIRHHKEEGSQNEKEARCGFDDRNPIVWDVINYGVHLARGR